MKIFPAIDLKDGMVVRLTEGDYGEMTKYDIEPCAAAISFAQAGAKYLHVVDLDGAKDGELSNYDTVKEIIEATDMFVEIGGGIRDEERIKKYLEAGAGRVILGTIAAKKPEFVKEMVDKYGDKIAVGVDAKDGKVAVDGWMTVTDIDSVMFCKKLKEAGVKSIIYTDISKDGKMEGTNHEIYRELVKIEGIEITASGGISSLGDIRELMKDGVPAAIVGKAIYNGKLVLNEILATVE